MIHISKNPELANPDLTRRLLSKKIARLESLVADLRRILAGTGPTPEELSNAPVLDNWQYGDWREVNLLGVGRGHPSLPDGRIYTSPVCVIDLSSGWARTTNRWYVIGDQSRPGAIDAF